MTYARKGRAVSRWVMLASLVAVMAGCSLKNPQLFDSARLPPDQQVVVSALGDYPERELSLYIYAINGKPVNGLRSPSFHLPPGEHTLSVQAVAEMRVGSEMGALTSSMKVAKVDAVLTAVAGHSYVPNAVSRGNRIAVRFDDLGTLYPQECLPFYRVAARRPILAMYRHKKVCNLPMPSAAPPAPPAATSESLMRYLK